MQLFLCREPVTVTNGIKQYPYLHEDKNHVILVILDKVQIIRI